MTHSQFEKIRHQIPQNPGIYKYFNKENKLIYVGKAKNLLKRVSSYFVASKNHNAKTRILIKHITRIKYTIVNSEEDALLLENNLIKQHQPKYNIRLRDDKSYPYICIKKEPFPRVFYTRNVMQDGSEYYGPYTSIRRVKSILEYIKSIYTLRTCSLQLSEKNIKKNKFTVCLEYHIKNCKGPCQGLQNNNDYDTDIKQIRQILKGKTKIVIDHFKQKMHEYANLLEFEKAEKTKQQILLLQEYQSKSTIVNPKYSDMEVFAYEEMEQNVFIGYAKISNGAIIKTHTYHLVKKLDETKKDVLFFCIQNVSDKNTKELILPFETFAFKHTLQTIPKIGDKKKLLQLCLKNAKQLKIQRLHSQIRAKEKQYKPIKELKKQLKLKELPIHIECFDNSNIQGTHPVAGVVVFREGKPSKKEYRHFNIKTVKGPNDYASMSEIVFRRYHRLINEKKSLPQLIIIDGGKGQLHAAIESLQKLGIQHQITTIGIAKRLEEIYFYNDPYPLHLDKRSIVLKLIQKARDEVHRFALTFHRKKRLTAQHTSTLNNIKGIGIKTQSVLLQHFKSVKKIRTASLEEITSLIGKHKAEIIKTYFQHH